MSKMKVVVCYDAKVAAYMPPHFFLTRLQAVRSITDVISDPQAPFYKHPEDYAFFEIGEFDEATAEFTQHPAKFPLGTALELRSRSSVGTVGDVGGTQSGPKETSEPVLVDRIKKAVENNQERKLQ